MGALEDYQKSVEKLMQDPKWKYVRDGFLESLHELVEIKKKHGIIVESQSFSIDGYLVIISLKEVKE